MAAGGIVFAKAAWKLTALDAESRLQPALARDWRVEADGLRLVFELREGLTFSDGSELDAEDVRRSWLRVIDPRSPSPLASLLDDDELYIVRMRVYLDFDELPLPLRIRAYSTSAWRPDSGWKVWPLH